MRATKSGMVIGTAVEDYFAEAPDKIGKIPVSVEIKYNEQSVKDQKYTVKKNIAPWGIALSARNMFIQGFFLFVLLITGYFITYILLQS